MANGKVQNCKLGGLSLLPAVFAALAAATWSSPLMAGEGFDDQQKIITPMLLLQRMEMMRQRVSRAVAARLRADAGAPDTASAAIAGLVISPVSGSGGNPLWQLSSDASYTNLDNDETTAPFKTDQFSTSVALDYTFSQIFIAGVTFAYDSADTKNSFPVAGTPGTMDTNTYSIGPYAAVALTSDTILTGSFLYSWADTDLADQVSPGRFNSESWAAVGTLTHYFSLGHMTTLAPTVGVSYSRNRDKAYADNVGALFPKQTTYTGVFSFGATLAKGFNLGNGRKIEPSIGVEGTWEFDLFGRPPLNAGQVNSSTNNGQVDVTVSGGLTLDLARAVKLKLNGSAGGLARSKYRELSGGGQISVQF